MQKIKWTLGLTVMLLVAAAGRSAGSGRTPPNFRCYWFSVPASPAAIPFQFLPDTHELRPWCYYDFDRYRLIFEASHGVVRPETAALFELGTDGRIEAITQAVRAKGEIWWLRRLRPGFNPFDVPLNPEAGERVMMPAPVSGDFALTSVQNYLAQARLAPTEATETRVKAGNFSSYLVDAKLPWRGYWWPFSKYPLGNGANSPLAKYDQMIKQWTGRDPRSRDWEAQNHALNGIAWGGHCNGWAAASVLYAEPRNPVTEPRSSILFSVSDLKGLLTESSFCVDFAFYGNRYEGPPDDLKDIYPDLFHEVLVYYIDGEKKPVAVDYLPDARVDNHVITGYQMQIDPVPEVPNRFRVQATLRIHRYDMHQTEAVGVAEVYSLRYEYYLNTDADGNILAGEWISGNPDFLWVPLAQSNCAGENPQVDPDQVEKIIGATSD